MEDRLEQWKKFSKQVELHVEQYTKAQYNNQEGNDQAKGYTVEDCFQNLMKYVNRRKSNLRGNTEKIRDLLKISHYACFAYDKLKKELGEGDIYKETTSTAFHPKEG